MISEKDFLKEKELLLNSIEQNTSEHWKNYYKDVPIDCIYDDLVIDINEIKRQQEEIKQLKGVIETYEILIKANNINNWNELKKFVAERIKFLQEEKAEFEEDLYNNYETNNAEITIRRCNLTQLEDVQEKMQELEGNNE